MKKLLLVLLVSFISAQDIACVGNSITANGYPEIVDFWMEQDGYEWNVHNFGVSGAGIIYHPYKNTQEYQDVWEMNPTHIIIKLGTNDLSGYSTYDDAWKNYWDFEYREIVQKFIYTDHNVILGTIIYRLYTSQEALDVIDIMNEKIRKVAQDYNLHIIDFNSAIGLNPDYFQADGVHPTNEGKYKLARTAYDYFKTLPITLGIEDEYWEAVEDYDDQRTSLFNGCSMK